MEKIDEERLFEEYLHKAADLYRNGNVCETLSIWQEAYHRMPNNVSVKEMLMSAYFDTDKVKHKDEIIELGAEIYNSDTIPYCKGQAIEQLARTYAENGNYGMAEKWAAKAYNLMHSHEFIRMQILDDVAELQGYLGYVNYWYCDRLFYMAARINSCITDPSDANYTQAVNKSIAQIYEVVYPNDDMSFEDLNRLCTLHRCIAEDETAHLAGDETIVKHHLTRAMECALKSVSVEEHDLPHPLVRGRHVVAVSSDNKKIVCQLRDELGRKYFDSWRDTEWFKEIEEKTHRRFGLISSRDIYIHNLFLKLLLLFLVIYAIMSVSEFKLCCKR